LCGIVVYRNDDGASFASGSVHTRRTHSRAPSPRTPLDSECPCHRRRGSLSALAYTDQTNRRSRRFGEGRGLGYAAECNVVAKLPMSSAHCLAVQEAAQGRNDARAKGELKGACPRGFMDKR